MAFFPPSLPLQEMLIAVALFVAMHSTLLRPVLFFGGALLLVGVMLWLTTEEA